ncbi:MAG: TRAP transporter small permease [Burkholderiales bacterium]|nr:TRAP transporter small permease [Burkholderiales bacterium]
MKLGWLGRLEEGVIAFLLAVMTIISFAQVIARYVFNYSFVWALELVTVLFAWLIFLGMSYGVRVHAHIGVDAVVRLLPSKAARVLAGVAALLGAIYAGIFFYGGYVYVAKMYQVGILMQDMPIPQWVPRLILPIGFGLLVFRFLQIFWDAISGKEVRILGDETEEALKLKAAVEPEAGEGAR